MKSFSICFGTVILLLLSIMMVSLAYNQAPRSVSLFSGPTLASLPPILPTVAAHNPSVPTISEYGTPTINGVISPGEYNSCYSHSGTPPQSMMFCEKNDRINDYYAVQVTGSQANLKDVMYILFDNNHDGLICLTTGRPVPEDAIGLDAQGNFMDMRYCGVPSGNGPYPPNTLPLTTDVSGGGHSDGTGMVTYSATMQTYTFELSHPMNSGDFGADYSLSAGSTVGWCVYFWDDQIARVMDLPVDCFVQYAQSGQSPPTAAFFGDLTKLGQPIVEMARICITKFNDSFANGIQDHGESGLSGWTINVGSQSGTTDSTGVVCFDVIAPGTYTVSEVPQSGWTQTSPPTPGTYTVTVSPGQLLNLSFGNHFTRPTGEAQICVTKFNDLNGDGIQQSLPLNNEVGLQGWTINIKDSSGNIVATIITNSAGNGCAIVPAPATYTVSEVLPTGTGWIQTSPPSPGTYTVTVTPGQLVNNPPLSFGNQRSNGASTCNLNMTKTVTPIPGFVGQVTITLTVTNVGGAACPPGAGLPTGPGTIVEDDQITGLSFNPSSLTQTDPAWICHFTPGLSCLNSNTLPANYQATFTFTATVTANAPPTILNCANVINSHDTVTGNNHPCFPIVVQPCGGNPSPCRATFIAHFYKDRNDATGAGVDQYPFQVTVSEGPTPDGSYTSRVYVGTDVAIALTSLNPSFTFVVCTPMPSCLNSGQISDYTHISRVQMSFAAGQMREFNFYGLGVSMQDASMEGIPRISAEEIGANPILSFKLTSTSDGTVRTLSYNLTQQAGRLTLLDTLIDHDTSSAPIWAVSERGVAPGGSGGANLKPSLTILGRNEDKDGKIVSTILGRDDNCRIISSVQGGYIKFTRVSEEMGLFGVTGQWANGTLVNPLSPPDHVGSSDVSLRDSRGNVTMPNLVLPQFMVAPGSYTLEIKNITMIIGLGRIHVDGLLAKISVGSGQDAILDIETPALGSYSSDLLLHDGLNRAYAVQSTLADSTTINVSLSYAEGSTFWVATLLPKAVDVQSVQSDGKPLEYSMTSLASWNLLVTTATPGINSYKITIAATSTTTTSSSGSGPRCVIATAAYGSELAAPVQFLRDFRDSEVQQTSLGSTFLTAFNGWYYSWAPAIAQRIAPNENYKAATRALISPLIGSLYVGHMVFAALAPASPEFAILSAGLLTSAIIGLAYLGPVYALVWKLSKRRITQRTIYGLAIAAAALTFIATLTTGTFNAAANLTALTVVETLLLAPALVLRKITSHFIQET